MTTRYAVLTAVSTFRMRYVIPMKEGETSFNLRDGVTCEEFDEFSQQHLGETIVDHEELSEEEMLVLFDRDNDYLRSWTREKKIEWVHKLRGENM